MSTATTAWQDYQALMLPLQRKSMEPLAARASRSAWHSPLLTA